MGSPEKLCSECQSQGECQVINKFQGLIDKHASFLEKAFEKKTSVSAKKIIKMSDEMSAFLEEATKRGCPRVGIIKSLISERKLLENTQGHHPQTRPK